MLLIVKIKKNSQTPEALQIHNVYNKTMHDKDDSIHDEYDTSEDKNIRLKHMNTMGENS